MREKSDEALQLGIDVSDVNLPEILAESEETQAAFELPAIERQERVGQKVEADFGVELAAAFESAGWTHEEAVEQARLVTEKATRETKAYELGNIPEIVQVFLKRKGG